MTIGYTGEAHAGYLAIQRKATEWFIAHGPGTHIVLVPQITVKLPGEGQTIAEGTPRDAQLFKLIYPGGDGYQTGSQDGTHHRYDVIIVGYFDCEAEVDDVWEWNDQKYIIHSEYPFNNYERKFGCYSYGKKPIESDG